MTDAAITADDRDDRVITRLRWTVGDTWTHDEAWAVVLDRGPVDLTADGWEARAQARSRASGPDTLATWSSAATGPEDGAVLLGTAVVVLDGRDFVTSTVRMHHAPAASRSWGAFAGRFDCEVVRRVAGEIVESYTIASGHVTADQDVSR